MNSKVVIAGIVTLALVTSVGLASAKSNKSSNGQPFQALWTAINNLQTQFNAHTHTGTGGGTGTQGPAGPQGPVGPTGPQGSRGISGAGVIAFIDADMQATSTVYALKTNGQVWSQTEGGAWINSNMNIPTTTSAVVQFEKESFLDIMGNIWHWNGSAWVNVSHP